MVMANYSYDDNFVGSTPVCPDCDHHLLHDRDKHIIYCPDQRNCGYQWHYLKFKVYSRYQVVGEGMVQITGDLHELDIATEPLREGHNKFSDYLGKPIFPR